MTHMSEVATQSKAHGRSSARSLGGSVVRIAVAVVVSLALLLLGVISLGAAVGRFHAIPVDAVGPGVHVHKGALAVVTPVATSELRDGDIVSTDLTHGDRDHLYRVVIRDSWTSDIFTTNSQGRLVKLKFTSKPGRVAFTVPAVGGIYELLVGITQAIALLAAGALLVFWLSLRRLRQRYELRLAQYQWLAQGGAPEQRPAQRPRFVTPWWLVRLLAGVMATIGMCALTASANFTGSAVVSMSSTNAAHVNFTLPSVGATNRLGTGASNIAPGDLIERPLDLQIDGTTTANLITGVNLTVSNGGSSTNGTGCGGTCKLDDSTANSLRLWIQKCTSGAWTENGSSPGYTYTCTGGAGNVQDVLGSSGPYNPSANTCPESGTPSTVNAAESTVSLSNLTLTASSHNYLVIYMCLPTATGDTYQDASVPLTWTFNGVQRAGTTK
jgi:hypothetical protein